MKSCRFENKIRLLSGLFFIIMFSLVCFSGRSYAGNKEDAKKTVKYVAFSADTEAYFTPRDFGQFQGEYTDDIIKVCEEFNVPFTWLIIVDKDHIEVNTMAEKHYPSRKHIDEFSLHTHFKWFIMDDPNDFESFKVLERRLQWLNDAKKAIVNAGLPMPVSFRYGGGDSQDRFYHIEDLKFLVDELGVKNFLFSADRLHDVVGIHDFKHLQNNVWKIDGGRVLTLLSTTVFLDADEQKVISSINERLQDADYAILGCHDYRENVPANLRSAIIALNKNYDVRYVTIEKLGELIRNGTIKNNN